MRVYRSHKPDRLSDPFPRVDTDGTEDGVVADNKNLILSDVDYSSEPVSQPSLGL